MPIRPTVHPLLTPEFYPTFPLDSCEQVRGLHIPQQRSTSPEVYLDTPKNIKDKIFSQSKTRCLHFKHGFHMYISTMQGVLPLGENIIATHLMRIHYTNDTGYIFPDTIYGDVCIFGSSSAYHLSNINRDYSVPYQVVEQIIYLYEQI